MRDRQGPGLKQRLDLLDISQLDTVSSVHSSFINTLVQAEELDESLSSCDYLLESESELLV